MLLVLLPSEGASFGQPGYSSCRRPRREEQPAHKTSVCAGLQMAGGQAPGQGTLQRPGHCTPMKQELGLCTRLFSLCFLFSSSAEGRRRALVRGMLSWGGHHHWKGLSYFLNKEGTRPNPFFFHEDEHIARQ